jgi:hypothetical protein
VEERVESGRRPDHVRRDLRCNDDEGKVWPLRRDLDRPVHLHLLDVIPALAPSVKEEDERPAVGTRVVIAWQEKLVLAGDIANEPAAHGDNLRTWLVRRLLRQ